MPSAVTPDQTARPSSSQQLVGRKEAAIRAELPVALYPLLMRPDSRPKSRTEWESELSAVQPFIDLPSSLVPGVFWEPPCLDFGFPVTRDQTIAFSLLWAPTQTDTLLSDGTMKWRTIQCACRYVGQQIGCEVDFKYVWNAERDQLGGMSASCAVDPPGGQVFSFFNNYDAVLYYRDLKKSHVAKLRELLQLPADAVPKWYINGVRYGWNNRPLD